MTELTKSSLLHFSFLNYLYHGRNAMMSSLIISSYKPIKHHAIYEQQFESNYNTVKLQDQGDFINDVMLWHQNYKIFLKTSPIEVVASSRSLWCLFSSSRRDPSDIRYIQCLISKYVTKQIKYFDPTCTYNQRNVELLDDHYVIAGNNEFVPNYYDLQATCKIERHNNVMIHSTFIDCVLHMSTVNSLF